MIEPEPSTPQSRSHRRRAAAASVAVIPLLAVADWYFQLTFNASILYSAVLLFCWWYRSVRLVWALAAVAVGLTLFVAVLEPTDLRAGLHRGSAVVSILATAAILHAFINSRREVEAHELSLRR